MRSKIAKTIILIVFVVFLGINKVEAFYCSLNGYTLEYDSSGDLISAKNSTGETVEKYLESYFHPTSGANCPSATEAKVRIIDGGRTLYVAQIDEFTSNSNSATYGSNIGRLEEEDSLVACGTLTDIPESIPTATRIIYLIIQILVPIALIILGMIDFTKAVMAQKEDEIKKGQQTFIKRLIAAGIVFFVFSIVKLFASFIADDTSVTDCLNCFIDNECSENPVDEESDEDTGDAYIILESEELV